ncbi:MAG: hypothetical protein ABJB05_05560 [Parafilimonas sp.]
MNTYDLKLIAGRIFSKDFGGTDGSVIFNEKAITQIGFNKPQDALNKRIDFWGGTYTIIGVVKNFHQ